ncbi:hypothetical protein H9X57_14050 [Flavobacterium piscinae]|uniref:Uncharacterized protein n=1 Tax=Flavobacterium piscinae TaxID=2506424 RepID=A0A4Q1KWY3_9FLAO|nr:hypothetical protein [Flavobacterium piscinae]MBC8884048.1 hypothetical protein [Flavobacterium piscinae]RXR34841.1 hypothetical protein EQG68_02730 [Flavobacterium piscinae]
MKKTFLFIVLILSSCHADFEANYEASIREYKKITTHSNYSLEYSLKMINSSKNLKKKVNFYDLSLRNHYYTIEINVKKLNTDYHHHISILTHKSKFKNDIVLPRDLTMDSPKNIHYILFENEEFEQITIFFENKNMDFYFQNGLLIEFKHSDTNFI